MMGTTPIQRSQRHNGALLLIFLSWLIYTVSYLGKVNYSANITQIMDFYQVSKAEAGVVPSFFFFAYGVGQVLNGLFCKKYNIRWMIFLSLLTSAIINFVIALTTDFQIIKWLWMLNGLALSILWPTLVRLLAEVLPQKELGKSSVIMGTTVAAGTLAIYGLSSIYVFFGMFQLAFYTAAIVDAVAAVIWVLLYQKVVKMASAERSREVVLKEGSGEPQKNDNDKTGNKQIYMVIGILCFYAIIVNLTKDGLTTWVPSILKESFGINDSLSILLTLLLPIVAVFGNLIALSMHNRLPDYITHCFLVFVLLGGFVGMIIASISFAQIILTLIGLIVVNFFASSLNSLITSIFPIFMRGKVNSGLFAGVLNGFCYVGSTISSYGLGIVADHFGWIAVFWLLLGCCILAASVWGVYVLVKHFAKSAEV